MPRLLLLLPVFVFVSASVRAQDPLRATVFVHGGVAWPSSPQDFHDLWRPAPLLGVGGHLEVAPNVGLGGYATFGTFALDRARLLQDALALAGESDPARITVDGSTVRGLTLMAQTRFQFELQGDLQPYFLLGAGVLHLTRRSFSITRPPFTDRVSRPAQTAPALDVGGGFYIALSRRFRLLFEGHFFAANTRNEGTRYFTLVTGLALTH